MNTLSFIELLRGGSLTENEKLKVLDDLRGGESASQSSPTTTTTTGNSSPIVTVSFTSDDTSLPLGAETSFPVEGLDQVDDEDFKTGLFFAHFGLL